VSPRGIYSPRPLAISSPPNAKVDRREVEVIARILRQQGPLGVRELRRQAESRLWGPGRFGPALARAQREGLVRRVGRRTYAAV
jgi:hypothetical protein